MVRPGARTRSEDIAALLLLARAQLPLAGADSSRASLIRLLRVFGLDAATIDAGDVFLNTLTPAQKAALTTTLTPRSRFVFCCNLVRTGEL